MGKGEVVSLDKPRLLVIDDDRPVLEILKRALSGPDFEVDTVDNGLQGLELYAAGKFDAVLLDLRLPEIDGFEVLDRLLTRDPEALVIIMTGYGSTESVVRAMKAGAEDYLSKPLDLDHLAIVLEKALKSRRQDEELRLLKEQLIGYGSFEGLVGVSPAMQRVYGLIRRLAGSDTTVLIQGETGTGKELVPRAIHTLSPRQAKAFMPIHCGALSESILESELFGHEKGAFTGADKQKYGLIEQAQGGTLFLDEIGTMSPALQVKLLRVLQEREVLRVGGATPIPVDFRLLAATRMDLREQIEAGAFRADLFYRLSVVTIELSPLRERQGDIPLLVEHFLRMYAERNDLAFRAFTPEALQVLQAYCWPGNVRELEHAVEQAVVLGSGRSLGVADLPEHLVAALSDPKETELGHLPLRDAREAFERQYLEAALRQADGVVAEAARRAGIPRQYFYKKMKRYGISRNGARV
jgi:two-component system response regulator HydG